MESSLPDRRRIGSLIALAAFALAVSACSDRHSPIARAATASGSPVQLAVLGDSLAFGTGAGDTAGGFAFRIYRAIDAARPGSEITNVAIGGSTVTDVRRLQVSRLRDRRFDIVIVCVGGNDVVRGIPSARFARDYRDLVLAIRAAAPRAALVAIGVPDVSVSPLFADHAASVHQLASADDRAARDAVIRSGGRYVDLFALTHQARNSADFLSPDRFHPSDIGHERIAAQALPIVEAALRATRHAHRTT
jgi:lysophospholipase L1-like esterase